MTKYLIAVLFLSSVAMAEDECKTVVGETEAKEQLEIKTDVPKYLEGATIIVRLKDGRETSVPAEKYKVVARKQQFIVTKTEKVAHVFCTAHINKKNRISALGGYGAQEGLETSRKGSTVEVESNVGAVGGLQYQRMISDRFSLGVQAQTNKTGSLLLGFDL